MGKEFKMGEDVKQSRYPVELECCLYVPNLQ